MYQVLYQKYRSQTFDKMVGQTVISTTLKQTISSEKISHAYLFSGPHGTGKTSAAKILARAMNCPSQVDGEPCNHCNICRDITGGSLEDVIEIDAASNNGVDGIREIYDESTYTPSRATYKVYIIGEVHILSTDAFSAFLKTLEELTENVVFILTTTELHKIPATILSHMQRFEFKAIKLAVVHKHLANIPDKEKISYEGDVLTLIAHCAEGGMRDALSILDQALSSTSDSHASFAVAEEITGSVSMTVLDNFMANVLANQISQALTNLETIFDSGKSMSRFATDLLNCLCDLLVVQINGENTHTSQTFQENLATAEQNRIFTMIDLATKALPEVKNGAQPKIYAEVLTIQLSKTGEEISAAQVLDGLPDELAKLRGEVKGLEEELSKIDGSAISQKGISREKSVTDFKFKVDRVKILTIMEEAIIDSQKSKEYLEALRGAWNGILGSISAQDHALLLSSGPVLADSENAILAFDAAFDAEQTMKRTDLNDMFDDIMSKTAGFSPDILAVPRKGFDSVRTEFTQDLKKQRREPAQEEVQEENFVPEGFDSLADKTNKIEG